MLSGSIAEVASYVTDSGGWDSVQEDLEDTIADEVTRFVLRFVDRVGTEAGISSEHMKSLYAMIPGWSKVYVVVVVVVVVFTTHQQQSL